jgi:hypothetical protein
MLDYQISSHETVENAKVMAAGHARVFAWPWHVAYYEIDSNTNLISTHSESWDIDEPFEVRNGWIVWNCKIVCARLWYSSYCSLCYFGCHSIRVSSRFTAKRLIFKSRTLNRK